MKNMFNYEMTSDIDRIEVQIKWSDEFKKNPLNLSEVMVNGHQSKYPSGLTINILKRKGSTKEGRKELTADDVKKFFDALQESGIVIALYCDPKLGFTTNKVEFWAPWMTVSNIFEQRVEKTRLYDETSLGIIKIKSFESSFMNGSNRVLDAVDNLEMNRGFCTTPKLI